MARDTNQMLYSHINATHLHAKVQRSTYAIRFFSTFRASGTESGLWEMSHLGGSAQRGACESGAWQWGENSPSAWSGASGLQDEWSGGDWVAPSADRQWRARHWHAPSIGLDGGKGEWSGAPSISLDGGKGEWGSGGDRKKEKSKYDNVTTLGGSKHMLPLDDRKDLVFGALAKVVNRLPGAMPMFTRVSLGSWDVLATMSMLYILGRVDEKTPIRPMYASPVGVKMFSIADASKTLALSFESIFADVNERAVLIRKLLENINNPVQIMQYAFELGQPRNTFYGKRDHRQPMPHENDRYLRRRTTEEELGRLRKQAEIQDIHLSMGVRSTTSPARERSMAQDSERFDSITKRLGNTGHASGGGEAGARVEQPSTSLGGAIREAIPRKAQSETEATSRVNKILNEFRALFGSGFASGLSQSEMAFFQQRLRSQETRLKALLPGINVLPLGGALTPLASRALCDKKGASVGNCAHACTSTPIAQPPTQITTPFVGHSTKFASEGEATGRMVGTPQADASAACSDLAARL